MEGEREMNVGRESGIKGVEWKCDGGKTKLTDPQYYQHGRHLLEDALLSFELHDAFRFRPAIGVWCG
jgi:hypothetical protein